MRNWPHKLEWLRGESRGSELCAEPITLFMLLDASPQEVPSESAYGSHF